MNLNKLRFLKKGTAWFLAVALLSQPCLMGIAEASPPVRANIGLSNPVGFKVDPAIARIVSTHQTSQNSLHIHLIQDAHVNTSCQIHTAQLLDLITANTPIQSIYLEAGEGDVSLSFLREASLKERKQVGLEFIHKGYMQGAEYFNLITDKDIRLFGVEDQGLYQDSIALYRQILKTQEQSMSYLNQIQNATQALKARVYNDQLKQYDQKVLDYHKGVLAWTDYIDYLSATLEQQKINIEDGSGIQDYQKIRALEKQIDYEQASKQSEQIINAFDGDQRKVWNASQALNSQRINRVNSPAHMNLDRYVLLEQLASQAKASQRLIVGDIQKYFEYLHMVKELDIEQYLQSLEKTEVNLYTQLTSSSEEARLHEVDQKIQLLKKLVQLQADPKSFESYDKDKEVYSPAYLSALINRLALDQGMAADLAVPINDVFEKVIQKSKDFYNLTQKRDDYFVEQLLQQVESRSEKEAVLITGGYHTPNLERLLRQHNIAYTVWSPSVTHETDQTRYEKILLSQQPASTVMTHQLAMGLKTGNSSTRIHELTSRLGHSPRMGADEKLKSEVSGARLSEQPSDAKNALNTKVLNGLNVLGFVLTNLGLNFFSGYSAFLYAQSHGFEMSLIVPGGVLAIVVIFFKGYFGNKVDSLSPYQTKANEIFTLLKKEAKKRGDHILSNALKRVEPKVERSYTNVTQGGKRFTKTGLKTFMYILLTPSTISFEGLARYLMIRRSIGFDFDQKIKQIEAKYGRTPVLSYVKRHFWEVYSNFETLKRPQYYGLSSLFVYPYIAAHTFIMSPLYLVGTGVLGFYYTLRYPSRGLGEFIQANRIIFDVFIMGESVDDLKIKPRAQSQLEWTTISKPTYSAIAAIIWMGLAYVAELPELIDFIQQRGIDMTWIDILRFHASEFEFVRWGLIGSVLHWMFKAQFERDLKRELPPTSKTPAIPEILDDKVELRDRKENAYFELDQDVLVDIRIIETKEVKDRLKDEGSFVRDTSFVRAKITAVKGWLVTVTYYTRNGQDLSDISSEESIDRHTVWKAKPSRLADLTLDERIDGVLEGLKGDSLIAVHVQGLVDEYRNIGSSIRRADLKRKQQILDFLPIYVQALEGLRRDLLEGVQSPTLAYLTFEKWKKALAYSRDSSYRWDESGEYLAATFGIQLMARARGLVKAATRGIGYLMHRPEMSLEDLFMMTEHNLEVGSDISVLWQPMDRWDYPRYQSLLQQVFDKHFKSPISQTDPTGAEDPRARMAEVEAVQAQHPSFRSYQERKDQYNRRRVLNALDTTEWVVSHASELLGATRAGVHNQIKRFNLIKGDVAPSSDIGLKMAGDWDEYEKAFITFALWVNKGNVTKSATFLNLSRVGLHAKIKTHEINKDQYKQRKSLDASQWDSFVKLALNEEEMQSWNKIIDASGELGAQEGLDQVVDRSIALDTYRLIHALWAYAGNRVEAAEVLGLNTAEFDHQLRINNLTDLERGIRQKVRTPISKESYKNVLRNIKVRKYAFNYSQAREILGHVNGNVTDAAQSLGVTRVTIYSYLNKYEDTKLPLDGQIVSMLPPNNMEEFERAGVRTALILARGSITYASELLGVSRVHLTKFIKNHGIDKKEYLQLSENEQIQVLMAGMTQIELSAWETLQKRKRAQDEISAILQSLEHYNADQKLAQMTLDDLKVKHNELKSLASEGTSLDLLLVPALALASEIASRVLISPAIKKYMRPTQQQLAAAIAMHRGWVVEKLPGEGKTLAIALTAYMNSLGGEAVRIDGFNDYLVARDAIEMGPFYDFFDLSLGVVLGKKRYYFYDPDKAKAGKEGLPYLSQYENVTAADSRPKPHQDIWGMDIVYAVKSQPVYDALHDNLVSNPAKALLPLRSSGLIIVDEMDSAMVDEASDPLIILPPEEGSEGNLAHEIIERIFKKSEQLIEGQDFVLDRIGRGATSLLSPIQIKELIGEADYIKVERKKIQLEQLIAQALRARYLFKNNVDYIVKANRIVIIDPFTGRLKLDHVWGGYLHEMVSAKEKLRFGGKIEIRGLATYQGDYRRAITQSKLTGISGTLIHVEATLMRDYDLRIMQVNRSVASIVIDEGTHLYESEKEKLDAIVMSVMDAHRNGRPVLIGVDSIESGERIKERLTFEGLDVSVLDGRTTLITERNIIESSGQPGQVTIGTPVIGRGVNVPLSQEAIANGGLKVIRAFIGATQAVDEQIQQRAGRQGQPGSFEVHLSREIDLKDLPSEVRTKELDVSLVRELQHRREDVLRKLKTDTLQYDILLNEWRYIYEQIRLRVIQDMYDPTKPATGELKILLGAIRKAWIPFLNQVMNYRNQLSIEEFERVLRIQFNQSIHEVIDKSVDIHKMQFLNDDFVNALSADWRALQNKLEFDPAKIAQSILNTLKRESNSRMTETEYIEFGVGYEDFRSEVIGQIEGALRVELGGESGDGHLTYQQIVDLIAGRSDRLQMASNTLVTTANPQEIETPPDLQMDAEAMLRLLAIMLIDNSDEYAIQESTLDELQTLIDLYNQLPSTNTPMSVVSLFGLSLKYFINSANYQEYGTHQLFEELSTKLTNIAKKSAQSERLRQVFDQALALSVFLHGSHLHSVMGDAEIDFRILLSNMRYLFAELESGQLDQVTAEMIQTGLARALVFVVPYFEHYPDFDPRGPAEEIESAFPQIIVSVENVQGFRDLIYQNKERIEQLAQDYFEGVKDLTLAGLSIFLYHNGAWGFEHIMGQSLGRLNVSPEILFLRPSHPNWIGNQPELMQELSITQQLAIVFPKPEYAAWDLTYFYQDDLFLKRIQYFEESLNKVDESWSSATRMAGGDAFQMAEEDAGIDAVEIRRRLKENPGQTNDYLLENVHRQHAALRNRRYDPSSLSHDQKQTLIKILMFSLMRLEGLPKNLNWESQAIEAKIEYLAELGLNTAADQLEARAISQKPSIFGGGSDFIGEEILRSFRAQVAFVRAKAHVHRGEYDVAKDIMRESFAVKHLETLVESGFVLEAMEQLRKIFDHRFNWEHYTKQYYEEYALYLLKTLLRANLYQTAYQLLDFFGNPGIELAARNSLAQYQMNQGEVEAAKTLIRELSNPNDLKETRGALQKIERARLLHQLGEADLARDGLRQIQGEIDSNEASDWWAEAQIRLAQVMSEMRIDGADNRIIRVQTYVLGRVLDYNQIYSTEATHLMNYYLANEQYDLAQDFLDQINERWEKRYQDEAAKVRRKFTTNQSQVYVQNRLNEMKNKKLFKHSIWQWMIDRHMANEPPHDALEVSIIIDSLNKYDSSIDAYLEINDTLGIEDVLRVAQKQNDTPHTSRHPSIPFSRYMVGRLGFIPLVELPTYINAWLDGLSKGEADISQADLETLIYWLSQDDESSAFGDVFKRRQRMLQLLEVYLSRQIKNLNLNMEGNRRVAEWRESMRRELVEVRRMDRLKGDNRRKVNFVNELKKRNQNTREFVVQIQPLIHSLGIEKFPSTLWHVLFAHKSQRRLREAHTLLSHADKNPKHAPLIHQLVFANPNRLRGRKQDDYGKRLKLMNVLVEHVLPLYRLIARPGYSGAMQTVVGLVDELMKEVSDVSDMDKRILNIENLSQYIMSQILDEDVRLRHDFEFTDDYMNALFYFSSNKSPELKQLLIIYAREGIDSARTYISNLPGNESYRGHVNWIEGIGAISSRVEMRGSVRDSLESQKEQLVGFMKKHLEELSKQNSDIFKRNGINIEGASYDSIVVWSSEVQNNTSINQTPDYLAIVEHIQHVQGLETTTTYEVSKALSVAMEVDPIVALNLGVGFPSCLNCVNGSLRQYTLATVLDLNKRVIYVKDAKGHRIGRLSIQLTDQGIVPISAIYANSTLDIEPILIRYLFELSKSMNVPIVFPLGRFGKREILAQGDGFIIEVLDNVPIRIEGAFAGAMYSDLTQVVIFDQNSSKEISVPAIVARPKWNAWIQRELNLYDQSTRSAIQGLDDERLQKLMAMMNESHNLKLSGLYINLPTDQLEAWIDGGFSHPNVITHITDERTLDIVPTAPRLAEPRPSRMTQNDDDVERFAFTEEDIAYAKWTLFDEGLAELAMGGFGDLRQDQPMKPGGALYDFEINSSGQQALSEIVNARIKSYDNDDRVEVAPEQIDTDAAILMFEREGKLWPIGIIFSHLGKYSYIDVSEMYRAPSDFKNKMSWSMGRGKQNPAVSETILGQIKTYLINQNKNPSFDRAYALVLSSNIELDDLRRPTIPYRLKTAHLFNLYYLGPHLDGADISLDQLRYPNLEPVFFDPTDQFSHDWQDMLVRVQSDHPDLFQEDKKILIKGIGTGIDLFYTNMSGVASDIFQGAVWLASINQRYGQSTNQISNATNLLMQREGVIPADTDVIMMNVPGVDMKNDIQDSFVINAGYGINFTTFQALFESIKAHLLQRPDSVFVGRISLSYRSNGATLEYKMHEFIKDHPELQFDVLPAYGESEFYIVRSKVSARLVTKKADTPSQAKASPRMTQLKDWERELTLSISNPEIGRRYGLVTMPELTTSGLLSYSVVTIESVDGSQLTYSVGDEVVMIDDTRAERGAMQRQRSTNRREQVILQDENDREQALKSIQQSITQTDELMADLGVIGDLNMPIEIPMQELVQLAQTNPKEFRSQMRFLLYQLTEVHASFWGKGLDFYLSGLEDLPKDEELFTRRLIDKPDITTYIHLGAAPDQGLVGYLPTAGAGLERKAKRINYVVDGVGKASTPDWYRGIGFLAGLAQDIVPVDRRAEAFDTTTPESYNQLPSRRLLEALNNRVMTPFKSTASLLDFVANQKQFNLKQRAIRPLLAHISNLIRTIRTTLTMTSIAA